VLEAVLQGKLSRDQENMEDVLTSLVFGTFRTEDVSAGLFRFLEKTETIKGNFNLPTNLASLSVDYSDYVFWPMWPEQDGIASCEPDLLIRIESSSGKDILLLIEAKYRSGKSSEATEGGLVTDQLAKEWLHLCREVNRREKPYQPWLIYLTADMAVPISSINNAMIELPQKAPEGDPQIGWLSWRRLHALFKGYPGRLGDLTRLVERFGLTYYDGISELKSLPEITFKFKLPEIQLTWSCHPASPITWRFTENV